MNEPTRERPILLSGAMVRALLDGRKTQTRRAVKLPHQNPLGKWEALQVGGTKGGLNALGQSIPLQDAIWHTRTGDALLCPYGQPGDRLWVRESFCHIYDNNKPPAKRELEDVAYMADNIQPDPYAYGPWKPSIHMPRWASRITLQITGVRVQHLQDISEQDAIAEGIEKTPHGLWSLYGQVDSDGTYSPTSSFCALWGSLNGPESWDANPWVWVIEIQRLET